MKTIKERAYKYAKADTWDDVDGYLSDIYATNAYNAYVDGATEQKIIDDTELLKLKSSWEKKVQISHNDEANYKQGFNDATKKACELLKAVGVLTDDDSIMGFIKAMGE